MTRAALLALVALVGCTTAKIDKRADGSVTVEFTRTMTDAAVDVTPERLSYSSNPSSVAQQNITDALVSALGVAVGARPLAPLASPPMPVRAAP